MPMSSNKELMRLLNFTQADLVANHQGQLSFAQRVNLVKENELFLLGCVLVLPFALISWLVGVISIVGLMGLVIVFILLGLFNLASVKKLWDAARGNVQYVEGNIVIRVGTVEQRTFLGAIRTQWAYG